MSTSKVGCGLSKGRTRGFVVESVEMFEALCAHLGCTRSARGSSGGFRRRVRTVKDNDRFDAVTLVVAQATIKREQVPKEKEWSARG